MINCFQKISLRWLLVNVWAGSSSILCNNYQSFPKPFTVVKRKNIVQRIKAMYDSKHPPGGRIVFWPIILCSLSWSLAQATGTLHLRIGHTASSWQHKEHFCHRRDNESIQWLAYYEMDQWQCRKELPSDENAFGLLVSALTPAASWPRVSFSGEQSSFWAHSLLSRQRQLHYLL